MLIAFSVENFRSIRDLQTLSLEEPRADSHLEEPNVFLAGKKRLVTSAAIFGANASGKSNLLRAIIWFRSFVLNSSRESQAGDPISVEPFLLSTTTEKSPSHFEIEFFWEEHEYRYGFRVNTERVLEEWLYRKKPGSKPAQLFTRDGDKFEVSAEFFKEGKGLEARTRPNALFLSVCAHFNGPEAGKVMAWMRRVNAITGVHDGEILTFTAKRISQENHRAELLALAQQADFHISNLRTEIEESITPAPPEWEALHGKPAGSLKMKVTRTNVKVGHDKLDAEGKVVGQVEFDLQGEESEGTQKFVAISGPISVTLEQGSLLLIDELEARLHPVLTQALVDLFHGPANRHHAQLVCATHDVTLLEPERFRRDQVWFCEKNPAGATELYSLAEFDPKEVRPDSKFSRRYLLGLFGAVPRLGNFQERAAAILNHE